MANKNIIPQDNSERENHSKWRLETHSVSIPQSWLKKVKEEIVARFEIPEETMNIGSGAELIIQEGKTFVLTETAFEINVPDLNKTQLKSGKENKG